MAEFLVSESVRVRDGAAAGLPGVKVFRAHRPQHARPLAMEQPSYKHRPR